MTHPEKGPWGEVPAGVSHVDVGVWSYLRSWGTLLPHLLCVTPGLAKAAGLEYILRPEPGSPKSLPFLPPPCSLLPGILALSLPIVTARALVWPPSSSPDSVHSLLPVSLPPRHSLPHVARGIFLKRTSGYFPPLHKSFRDALWPAGQSPASAGMACEALHQLALPALCAPPARPHTCPVLQHTQRLAV